MEKIKVYMRGWLNYYGIAEMKNNMEKLNGWLYRRIRMCIWKQWKLMKAGSFVEGETAYCIDINTDFISGYKTRADASTRMSDNQISDVALSLEYVKQYAKTHNNLNDKQVYLLEQCVVWQRLSVHLGWECNNVRASYDEIPKSVQDEVYAGAKTFVKANKGRYECGGYIYSGQGQELGQFWAELAVGNAILKKASSNTSITDGNGLYSIAGATYGAFSDKACKNQLAILTTDDSGNTETVEVKAGTVYIKESFIYVFRTSTFL